ncbi:short-chain dehydrogenase TIC [Salix suchowensis]|nr:short-chain dehydrogenase TIC [Salix suchowensis]
MKETLRYLAGIAGPSGYGSNSTAEQVIQDYACSDPLHLTAIITGATSGIGVETARALAKKGLRIVIPARNLRKADELKEVIRKESPKKTMLGIYSQKLEFSEDKIEMTFATNYLGHFLLTELLLEKMIETAEKTGIQGRIINLSSAIHSWVRRDGFCFNNMLNPRNYDGTSAYSQSKLANILHVKEVATKLQARNARVTINAVHPGIVKTGIMRESYKGFITDSLYFTASKLLKSTSQGASTTCYVALSPQVEGVSGKYFADCNESDCSALANDELEAQKLWMQTNALLQRYLYPPPAQHVLLCD